MLGILNRFRAELGVVARPAELDAAVIRTKAFLQSSSASSRWRARVSSAAGWTPTLSCATWRATSCLLRIRPDGAWLRVDRSRWRGTPCVLVGEVEPTGAIAGNDNDRDAARFEPHYREIRSGDEVQIYEAIMGTATGQVTTGLLSAVTYSRTTAFHHGDSTSARRPLTSPCTVMRSRIRTSGRARIGCGIRSTPPARAGPFTFEAQLWYQSIAYRWARNLDGYKAAEPRRFVAYYDQVAPASALMLTSATTADRPPRREEAHTRTQGCPPPT